MRPPHTHPVPSISPTCPLEGNLSLSVPLILGSGPLGSPTLSLIHPSFPSSSPGPPPLPLALLQHNGLAACRFHDTLTPSLPVLWCGLSQTYTGPGHFHTALTPRASRPLTTLTASKAGAHTPRSASCKLKPDPWEGGPEAPRITRIGTSGGAGEGGHSYLLQGEVSPQQLALGQTASGRRGVGPESHSGSNDLPRPPPHRRPGRGGELCSSQASSFFAPHWGYHQRGGRSSRASP